MKPDAVMINVGRGAVIDEPALIHALRHQRIRGAALDVFAEEPLPPGHPMYGLDNLLLSPPCTDHTRTWIDDAMVFFTGNLERFLRGAPLRNVVEKAAGVLRLSASSPHPGHIAGHPAASGHMPAR